MKQKQALILTDQIIYNKTYFHKCAEDVGVSVDYYLEEFV